MMKSTLSKLPSIAAVTAIFLTLSMAAGMAQSAPPVQGGTTPPAITAGPVLVAKIDKTLSTKNAKVGDPITAKTLKTEKTPDGAEIAKGSKLIGQIVFVKSKEAGNGNSILAFRFDKVEVKGGSTLPIKGFVFAIGPSLAPDRSIGANSVLGRGGVGSTPGMDPSFGLGKAGAMDETNIPKGSTLEGVGLGVHKDADWTTALRGVKRDIFLDSDVLVKVEIK